MSDKPKQKKEPPLKINTTFNKLVKILVNPTKPVKNTAKVKGK